MQHLRLIDEQKLAIIIAGGFIGIWLITYVLFENISIIDDSAVFLLSWIGIIEFLLCMWLWRRSCGRFFSPFSIFLCFITVFNFGQCFLWAFEIHHGIGVDTTIFRSISVDSRLVAKAQLMYLLCAACLTCCALFSRSSRLKYPFQARKQSDGEYALKQNPQLLRTSLTLLIVSAPIALYSVLTRLITSRIYGYAYLYSEAAAVSGSLLQTMVSFLGYLFIPCLFGVLLGSAYSKRYCIVAYSLFSIYAISLFLCGDRGEWVIPLVMLFWADGFFRKRKKTSTIVMVCVCAFLGLTLLNAITDVRDNGNFSILSVLGAVFNFENNPIVSLLMEFGGSMGVTEYVLREGLTYPYNTYVMDFLTACFGTSIVIDALGISYIQPSEWIPIALNLTYGTDFSFIGEALINFDPYFAWIPFCLMGLVFGMIDSYIARPGQVNAGTLWMLFASLRLCVAARSTLWVSFFGYPLVILIFMLVYKTFTPINNEKKRLDCIVK